MTLKEDLSALVFDLQRQSPFFFKCQRCRTCCANRTIQLEPYEILRISRNLGSSTNNFLKNYVEEKSSVLRNKPHGECIFLSSQGCAIHPDRPLVCRLYPLGLIWNSEGEERFSNMPPHPDCLGFYSHEGTVNSYLESQGAEQYFRFEKRYSPIHQRIKEKFPAFGKQREGEDDRLFWKLDGLGDHAAESLLSHLFDSETTVQAFCRKHRIKLPTGLDEIVDLHIKALSFWLETL